MSPRGKTTRLVVVADDYLDGIMALTVSDPGAWDETARRIPVAAIEQYEAAWEALRAAERRLRDAWNAASDEPNPTYEPSDDTEAL